MSVKRPRSTTAIAQSTTTPNAPTITLALGLPGPAQLDACARVLARFAVEKALSEQGLDMGQERSDHVQTNE